MKIGKYLKEHISMFIILTMRDYRTNSITKPLSSTE